MQNIQPNIYKKEGALPGKTVAIMAGVHGNEKAGIMALDYLNKNLQVARGCVYLIYANPVAIEKHVRYEHKNLNRNFYEKEHVETYEDILAENIMKVLDDCDALLDLHSYREPLGESIPFLIAEPGSAQIIKNMDFKIVVSGLNDLESGASDGYMNKLNKMGICAELGAIEEPEKFVDLGIETSYRFLEAMGLIEGDGKVEPREKLYMQATMIYKKKTNDFSFVKPFKTFEAITKGQILAHDGVEVIRAPYDGFIIFPRDFFPVGVEAFILAK